MCGPHHGVAFASAVVLLQVGCVTEKSQLNCGTLSGAEMRLTGTHLLTFQKYEMTALMKLRDWMPNEDSRLIIAVVVLLSVLYRILTH